MTEAAKGLQGKLIGHGQHIAEGAVEHLTGLKVKGFFSGLLRAIGFKTKGKAKVMVSAADHKAAQGGVSDYSISLRKGKSPALALDSLRQRVRQPAAQPQAAAREQRAPSAAAPERGEAQLRMSVIEESLAERSWQCVVGIHLSVADLSASALPPEQADLLQRKLLSEIAEEFGRLRQLQREPAAGLSQDEASRLETQLAIATLRLLAPASSAHWNPVEVGENLASLSDQGVLTAELLLAVRDRVAFWIDKAKQTPVPATETAEKRLERESKLEQSESDYAEGYLRSLANARRLALSPAGTVAEALREQVGHTKPYAEAVQAHNSGSPALMNDLRLRVHGAMVDELLQFGDRHSQLALDLKLLAANGPQEKQLLTLRHELEQVKKYLFELASVRGSGIDKASFRTLALDAVLLKAWKDNSVATRDINILIGQALALQGSISSLETSVAGRATSAHHAAIVFDDLRRIGLTEKSLGELRNAPNIVQDILETARSFAETGFSGTRDLQKFRELSKSAFRNVLNSSLVNLANADIGKLQPAERAQVLGILIERQRAADVGAVVQDSKVLAALDALSLPAAADGESAAEQKSDERYRSIEAHLGQEVERLVSVLDQQRQARDRLTALAASEGLKFDPEDRSTRELAANIRVHVSLVEQRNQLRGVEDKLVAERRSIMAEGASPAAIAVLDQDLKTTRDMIVSLGTQIRVVDAAIVNAKGPLANRLWNNPDTEPLNVTAKLSVDAALSEAVDALVQYADAKAQHKHSEASVLKLSAGLDQCIDARRAAMGEQASSALSLELRYAVASSFAALVTERQLAGEPVETLRMRPIDHREVILAEIGRRGIPTDVYAPEISRMLHSEIGLADIEQWLKEAKAADKKARTDAPRGARPPEQLAAESEQVLASIAGLKPDERFFLGAGYGVEAMVGGVKFAPSIGAALMIGGGKDALIEVRREGDQAVLRVADSQKLSARLGAKAKFGGEMAIVQAGAVGSLSFGQGFVARYNSPQDLADAMRRLYVSKGEDSSALTRMATSVSLISESEKRIDAGISASVGLLDLGEALADIGAEKGSSHASHGNEAEEDSPPFGLHLGASAKAGVGYTRLDTTLSNNQTQTVRQARSYDIQIEAGAGIGLQAPTLAATAAKKLDVKDKGVVGQQFAGKAESMQKEGSIELLEKNVGWHREKVVSELAVTHSVRDQHLQAVSRSFRFGAPQGMSLERMASIAPGYVRQIRELTQGDDQACVELFGQIGKKDVELTLTARLKPALMAQWNADREAARQALEFERPLKSAAAHQRDAKALERRFARRLEAMTRDDANMQVTGLALHKSESASINVALNAVLVKAAVSARAGVGELVNEIRFVQPKEPASSYGPPRDGDDEISRLLAEANDRRSELLGRLEGSAAQSR